MKITQYRKNFQYKRSKNLTNLSIYALNDCFSSELEERYYNQYLGINIKNKEFSKYSKGMFNIFLDGIELTGTVIKNHLRDLIDEIKEYSYNKSFKITYDGNGEISYFKGSLEYSKIYDLYNNANYFQNEFYINKNGKKYPSEEKRYYESPLDKKGLDMDGHNINNKIYEIEQNMTIKCNKLDPKNSDQIKYILSIWFNPNKFILLDKDMQTHEPLLRFFYDFIKPKLAKTSVKDLHLNIDLNVNLNNIEVRKNKRTIKSNNMTSKYINNLNNKTKDKLMFYDKNAEISKKKSRSYYSEEEIEIVKESNIKTTRIELRAINGEQVANYLRGNKHILGPNISILYKFRDENGRRHQRSLKDSLNASYSRIPKILEESHLLTEDIYLNTLNKHADKKHPKNN